MTRVVFDSSFLMAVAEHPTRWREDIVAVVGGFEPVALECVLAELGGLSARGGKKGQVARVALELAEGFSRVPSGTGRTDDEISSAALSLPAAVATVDGDLARALRVLKVQVFGLRAGRVAVV